MSWGRDLVGRLRMPAVVRAIRPVNTEYLVTYYANDSQGYRRASDIPLLAQKLP